MTAAGAELVGRPDGTEAVSAACGELIVTLRAEVEVALDVGATGGAFGNERGAQEEVEDGADSARHNEADQHPESRAHGATGCVFADVANHEDVERGEKSPSDV